MPENIMKILDLLVNVKTFTIEPCCEMINNVDKDQ